jgi:hypothetical protein
MLVIAAAGAVMGFIRCAFYYPEVCIRLMLYYPFVGLIALAVGISVLVLAEPALLLYDTVGSCLSRSPRRSKNAASVNTADRN